MSSMRLAFTSDGLRPLSTLAPGTRGVVGRVAGQDTARIDRLLALGVTPGVVVVVLQTFPGIVFMCDQTELAIERRVADAILVRLTESGGSVVGFAPLRGA